MKNNYKILWFFLLLVSAGGMLSCNKSFLDRYPETSMNQGSFFSNTNDLNLYLNGLYNANIIAPSMTDVASDNILSTADQYAYKLMRGEVTSANVGSWSSYWTAIRNINFFLDNAGNASGSASDINHYIGIGRFFRAYEYYELVKQYSNVPWYSHTLSTSDSAALYKTQDPRSLVVDSIMSDLNFAVANIKDSTSKTRISKWTALAGLARIALNEGTMRKYHPELGLTDANKYLQIARDASLTLINSGKFSIYKVNGSAAHTQAYESLFNSADLSGNPEMIMIKAYDLNLGVTTVFKNVFNNTSGLSRDLMEDYLAVSGNNAIPFQQVPGYDTLGFTGVFSGRDPRLKQTFMQPGYIAPGTTTPVIPKFELGYVQEKYYPLTADQIQLGGGTGYDDMPIYRLGEVYLNYAEARAELGELTQADIDMTINILRDRVQVPHATLSNWLANIDPRQAAHYPNVSGAMQGAILEIRRERRVELACEGFRWQDLMRWGVGKLAANTPQGIYVPRLGYLDVTGDGVPDMFIGATVADLSQVTSSSITKYSLDNALFSLSNGTSGYVQLKSQTNKYNFIEPKYYYKPMYDQDMLISPSLVQISFWK
jgi:SusD family.